MDERKEQEGASNGARNEMEEALNMEDSLAYGPAGDARPGDILQGKVVHISQDGVLVDVGAKSEGIIHLRDLSHRRVERAEDVVQLGDVISVYVLGHEGEEGALKLSKRRADEEVAWERLEEAQKNNEVLEAPVVEVVKGGLVVDVGLRGFVPASLIAPGFVHDLEPFLGQPVRVRVVEIDRHKRRAILSRKDVLAEETKAKQEEIWSKIEEGQIWDGTVKSITDFGAFIDLGGVDGLLHISEMSWTRINHPSEILEVGQPIRVKVIRLNPEKGKISLGLRQVEGSPWDKVAEHYLVGNIYRGQVVRLATFGVFVQLEPGVDGLVHISQLADYRVTNPSEVVQIGDEIAVKVLQVDPERKRISLSKREADAEGGLDAVVEPEPEAPEEPDSPRRMAAYHAGDWDDELGEDQEPDQQ
ncbi:30S ribosomal protein S1 [Sulfobacillus harzensis]|uniref:30S ribosomal protein S1 n=1 Tax=Sulfobacillus harzensis TaxID=2729629 RepID=A0A7Y0L358_9FIRM|nr:30S ribosomal protein S1 [Sulfobacillus harzensis]NMP22454.1 30S ribosomal protein S1 [Sulfobacillus harzensis]